MNTPTPNLEMARSLFFEGLEHLKEDRLAQARDAFESSLRALPGRVSTQVNLTATLLRMGETEEALKLAKAILAVEPNNLDAIFHAGHALQLTGRLQEALTYFDAFWRHGGDSPVVALHQAQTLHRMQRLPEALLAHDRALKLDPTFTASWTGRGEILRELGRLQDAAASFERAIEHGDETELTRYYLASVRPDGQLTPSAAPNVYVEALFDGYAQEFDQHLVGVLGYRAHQVIADVVAQRARERGRPFEVAADLGCGTGLCGALVRAHTTRLTGVDLSAAMLEQARARGAHDELVQQDIVSFLRERPNSFDLLLAADVLIYIGDLEPVWSAARQAMRSSPVNRPIFILSLEETTQVSGYLLQPSLRYAHSENYVRESAQRHGFAVLALQRLPIREDQRESIPGLYVVLAPT